MNNDKMKREKEKRRKRKIENLHCKSWCLYRQKFMEYTACIDIIYIGASFGARGIAFSFLF